MALKAAETDGTKRALATFGRPFGLELYRGGRSANPKAEAKPLMASPSLGAGNLHETAESAAPAATVITGGSTASSVVPPEPAHKTLPHVGRSAASAPLPSDTAPIARPSRHYGRQRYVETREHNAALMRKAEGRAVEASLVPSQPDLLPPGKIDKSVLLFNEPKRLRDKGHLKFVGSQPCLVCGRQPADAHHLRFAQPRALGLKVSDEFTVPLCRGHHRAVHQTGNEAAWWEDLDINALEIARGLWEQSRGLNKNSGAEENDLSNSGRGPA